MANKLKKNSKKNPADKPTKAATDLKPEKEEKIDLKKLARDERTWKIAGALSYTHLLVFLYLLHFLFFYVEGGPVVCRARSIYSI